MARDSTPTQAGLVARLTGLLMSGLLIAALSEPGPANAQQGALDFEHIAKDGEMKYFSQRPDPNGYRYESNVFIDEKSLSTGIVSLSTCHFQLDPIRKVVIAFNRQRLISLQVVSHKGMAGVSTEANTVTLDGVERGGEICINLESKALDRSQDDTWTLHAGPLMRRYLDGYLPMQADLRLFWPSGLLTVKGTTPKPQTGVVVESHPDGALMQLVFAGRFAGQFQLNRPARP
ncbi:MAG: hypothetical protein RLY30_1880 [Pseudomonadota bacterium]|jgi:hypothetical protein